MREWQCTQQNTLLVCIFLFIFLWKVEGRNKWFIPNKSIMLRRKKTKKTKTKIWTSFIVYCLVQFDLYFWKLEDMLPIRGWVVLHVYYSLGNKTIIGDKARILKGCTISVILLLFSSVQFSSVTQSCLTLCDPMNCSMPGLPVHQQLLEFTQTHVHWVGDAIQLSHPLLSPSPALNPSQQHSLF